MFLSLIGLSSYKILQNLVSPVKSGDKSFVELVEALSKHFNPNSSEIVERLSSTVVFGSQENRWHQNSLSEFCNF